jgi:hypothetical protein
VTTKMTESTQVSSDRANDLVIMSVLLIDTVLLAMLELMFVSLSVGAIPLPISALVALLSTPWLVFSAGQLSRGWLGAAGPLIAWIATVCVLGFSGPGGDLIFVLYVPLWQLANLPQLLLIVAGLLPAAFVLGRVLRTKVRRNLMSREAASERGGEQ